MRTNPYEVQDNKISLHILCGTDQPIHILWAKCRMSLSGTNQLALLYVKKYLQNAL